MKEKKIIIILRKTTLEFSWLLFYNLKGREYHIEMQYIYLYWSKKRWSTRNYFNFICWIQKCKKKQMVIVPKTLNIQCIFLFCGLDTIFIETQMHLKFPTLILSQYLSASRTRRLQQLNSSKHSISNSLD